MEAGDAGAAAVKVWLSKLLEVSEIADVDGEVGAYGWFTASTGMVRIGHNYDKWNVPNQQVELDELGYVQVPVDDGEPLSVGFQVSRPVRASDLI